MDFRKLFYVLFLSLFFGAYANASEIEEPQGDWFARFPEVRCTEIDRFLHPGDLIALGLTSKANYELISIVYDFKELAKTIMKEAKNRYLNWCKEDPWFDSDDSDDFPTIDLHAHRRLSMLPLNPQDIKDVLSSKMLDLAIDKYGILDQANFQLPLSDLTLLLLSQSKTLRCIELKDNGVEDFQEWEKVLSAVSKQGRIDMLTLSLRALPDNAKGAIVYLNEKTDESWRNKVIKLSFYMAPYKGKITSSLFFDLLGAFPNLKTFDSTGACYLFEEVSMSDTFPILNKLQYISFKNDVVNREFLFSLKPYFDHMPELIKISIMYCNCNNDKIASDGYITTCVIIPPSF